MCDSDFGNGHFAVGVLDRYFGIGVVGLRFRNWVANIGICDFVFFGSGFWNWDSGILILELGLRNRNFGIGYWGSGFCKWNVCIGVLAFVFWKFDSGIGI